MEHSFDIKLAAKYGILEAVIIKHFQFWLAKNKANQIHFHDGKYWTYNSIDAFQKLFPYASYDQIRRALERLRKKGVLLTGKYNKERYNHTIWYSLSDSFCIDTEPYQEQRQNDLAFLPERSGVAAKTITDIDITDNNIDNSSLRSELSESLLSTTITEKNNNNSSTTPYSPPSKAQRKKKSFTKPTIEEITNYCKERGNNIDPQHFFDYYESKGWLVGKTSMVDWKAAVRNWERNNYNTNNNGRNNNEKYQGEYPRDERDVERERDYTPFQF